MAERRQGNRKRRTGTDGESQAPQPSSEAGGQSGDLQGLTDTPVVDSESVAELLEEGQSFEAGVVQAIEDAPDPDVSEVKTKELPEDDVPLEYLERDNP